MSEGEFIEKYVKLVDSLVRQVYCREVENNAEVIEEAREMFRETAMTPLQAVMRYHSPKHVGNKVLRGQKAREARYRRWVKRMMGNEE